MEEGNIDILGVNCALDKECLHAYNYGFFRGWRRDILIRIMKSPQLFAPKVYGCMTRHESNS
jgi:hypothetical protein